LVKSAHDYLDQREDVPVHPVGSKPRRKRRNGPRAWRLYLVLLPVFSLLALTHYYPAISGIYHSFYHWRPGYSSPFAGLSHLRDMLKDTLWWQSFEHISEIFAWGVTLGWIFPLIAAELIITLRSQKLRFVFRTLLIVPFAFPLVVRLLIWDFMYDPNTGLINTILGDLGLKSLEQNWLGNPHTALISLLFINFPWVASLPFLIFLAALQNIPTSIFEAAQLDGAGRLRRLWSIDLPLLGRQFKLLIVLAIIEVLQYGVASQILTAGGPNYATNVPVLAAINAAFNEDRWGYGATLGSVLFLIILILSSITLLIRRRQPKPGEFVSAAE